MLTRTLLAALAVASLASLTAPAEARPTTGHIPTIDVAAIPAYPLPGQLKARPAARGAASRSVRASRTADHGREARKATGRPPQGQTARRSFVTVETAAGISITGEPAFIVKAAAVISDLADAGYKPRKLTCLSYSRTHVKGSYHFQGRACDVAQCGWGCTPAPKVVLRLIVARHGLRDGCEFRDAGHFDDGPRLPFARVLRHCGAAYAAVVMPLAFAARVKPRLAAR